MNCIRFGNGCFNIPSSEQSVDLVIGAKSEADSLEDFVERAVKYLCDEVYFESLESAFSEIINKPAGENGEALIRELMDGMNTKTEFKFERILNIIYITEPKWNSYEFAFETENGYVLFLWGTTA